MEIASRELFGNLLLTSFALRKNFNVYIGDTKTYKTLLEKNLINPGIIHTKSITHGKKKSILHDLLLKKKFIITSQDQEHGVLDNLNYKKFFLKSRVDSLELKKVDAIFCWGQYDYKNLREYYKKYKNKFYLTGSPRADIWKKKIYTGKHNDDEKKPYILVCTNFSFSNNRLNFNELIRNKKKAGYYRRSPELLKKDKEFYSYQRKLIYKFVNLINHLTKKYENLNFFLRPHPTENINFWINNLVIRKNLKIKNYNTSSYWIQNCDLLIQSGCTTGAEGVINGKPVINYCPIKSKTGFGEFIGQVTYNVNNNQKIFSILNKLNFNKLKNSSNNKKLNKRILFLDKKLSSEKISNLWFFLSRKIKFGENKLNTISFFLFVNEIFSNLITNIILILKGKYEKISEISNFKFPNYEKYFIYENINSLSHISKNKKKIFIKKLGKRFWYFETK